MNRINVERYMQHDFDFEEVHFIQTDNGEISDLHVSILNEDTSLLAEQLKHPDANKDIRNRHGESPLLAATRIINKTKALKLVRTLIDANANVNLHDKFLIETPLHEVSSLDLHLPDNYEMFMLIAGHPKCNLNCQNWLGETPLHLVRGLKGLKVLLELGADVHVNDQMNNNLLHTHVENAEICRLLLEAGLQVNQVNVRGLSALHEAVRKNQLETVSLLLDNGADVNIEMDNLTPFTMSYELSSTNEMIREKLWAHTAPVYLIAAARHDSRLIPKVMNIWNRTFKTERQIVSFCKQLSNFIYNTYDHEKTDYGKIAIDYFLLHIKSISSRSAMTEVIQSFQEALEQPLINFILRTYPDNTDETRIESVIAGLLSYGCRLDYSDMDFIYLQFGDSKLLRFGLVEEIDNTFRKMDSISLFSRILCDLSIDLTGLVKETHVYGFDTFRFFDLWHLARYCTLPAPLILDLETVCTHIRLHAAAKENVDGSEGIFGEMRRQAVPPLKELARNKTRVTLAKRFETVQVCKIVASLRVFLSPVIVDIIMLKRPLYPEIRKPNPRYLYSDVNKSLQRFCLRASNSRAVSAVDLGGSLWL